jgi:hypothetical protein
MDTGVPGRWQTILTGSKIEMQKKSISAACPFKADSIT